MNLTMKKICRVCLCCSMLLLITGAAIGEEKPANVSGKWQLSWEARIATESGTLQLEQANAKLNGSFQGGPLGSPKVSGTVDGKNITLTLEFRGTHNFTVVFSGTIDSDRMAGKFSMPGFDDGYDYHGENTRPSNYSWKAIRQPDQTQSASDR